MRNVTLVAAVALALGLATEATAQQAPNQNTVLEAHRVKPKPGMRAQLEAGRKKHMAWHKQQGDTWAWHVWEVLTGPDTGAYIVVSPNHQWADFDAWNAKMAKGDRADSELNLAPHQASAETSYWVMLADASRGGASSAAPAMGTLTTYQVRPGKADQFREALRTLKGALEKANFPRQAIWYSLVSGGPTSTFAVFTPRSSMADMALPNPPLRGAVEGAIGKSASDAAFQAFSDAIEGGTSELLEFRSDLSYTPTPAGS